MIRILLTGYADERPHAALLRPDAPFKVGKPWYDEIEVVLRRALEQRQRTNDLTSTLESAIGLGDLDIQLTAVASLEELGEVVTLRVAQLANVETAWLIQDGAVRVGQPQTAAPGGWQLERAIDRDGRIRIGAVGAGTLARDMVEHLVQSAQRRAGAIVVSAHAPGVSRSRVDELMRHATIGTITGSLLHDVASMLQSVDGAVAALVEALPADAAPDVIEAAHDVTAVAREAFELFVATRKFLSDGVVKPRRVPVAQLVQRVVRHCGGAVRERAQLRVVVDADVELDLADTLFVRSVADLVTAASTLAPSAVIGAGGLGAPLISYLAAAGIGTLWIFDHDVVDASNLQRQVLFSTGDIGQPKATCAQRVVDRLNPQVKVLAVTERISSANALTLLAPFDILVDATDNFPTRYLLNDAAELLGKPLVFGSIFRYEGQVSVFNFKGGPTYRDLYPQPPKPGSVPDCAEGGVLGVLPGIVGSMEANEVIKILAGVGEPLAGKPLLFDSLTLETRLIRLSKKQRPPILHLMIMTIFAALPLFPKA